MIKYKIDGRTEARLFDIVVWDEGFIEDSAPLQVSYARAIIRIFGCKSAKIKNSEITHVIFETQEDLTLFLLKIA